MPARWLQELLVGVAGIRRTGELIGDQIEHRVDFALVGVDLGEVSNALARANLRMLRF
ncbi:MAG: hypothetical protein V9E83_09260 [Baekduia sp.]